MKNEIIFTAVLMALMMLSGCASITTGQNQSIAVDSTPSGASCTLTNDKGTWYVKTPGTVTITRAYGDLSVICKLHGKSGSTKVSSATKGMAFGNILAGGIIGAAVDAGTGAAYDYPTPIMCPIRTSEN